MNVKSSSFTKEKDVITFYTVTLLDLALLALLVGLGYLPSSLSVICLLD